MSNKPEAMVYHSESQKSGGEALNLWAREKNSDHLGRDAWSDPAICQDDFQDGQVLGLYAS